MSDEVISMRGGREWCGKEGGESGGPWRRVRAWTAAGLLLGASACVVGPNYVRPPAVVPDSFKEMEGWRVAQPKDQTLRGRWWEIFNDRRLNELEEQVNVSNQNIAASEAQFRQALALVQAARAAYFPTVTIGPSFTRSFQSNPLEPSVPFSLFSLPLSGSWEPDLWGRIRRTVESSRASAQASAADLEGARLSAQTSVAQDYFQLRALDAQKALLDAAVVAYRKSLQLTQYRYASGIASRGDVLQADTQLKTTQAQAIDVGVQRAQFEHAIALLIGKPASSFSLAFEPLQGLPPDVPVGLPSELLERRPDVAAAERLMAAANAQIGVALSAFYPQVTLGASVGYQSVDLAKWFTWPSRFWSVGPSVSETVYEGGLRSAQTAQARAAYDSAIATYRQTVLTGFQQVEDNLAALRILEQEAAVQDAAVKVAEESLEVITNQYKSGTVDYLNVIVAQTIVLNNQETAANILGRRMTAAVLLINAIGGGWTSPYLAGE